MGWKLPTLLAVLWVIVLGVWAGVFVGSIGGPWGAVAGSVLTVLAGVVTAYLPSLRDESRRRAAENVQAQEALRQAGELATSGPAGLLDPRRGLVNFTGRKRELTSLLAWCEDGRARGLRLVTGPGGVGKTRLSAELGARLTSRGWRCLRVGDDQETSALAAARRGWPGPVLLVVDYAETRLALAELLRAVASDAGPVRVLMLARSAGEWWDRLGGGESAVRELLAGAGTGDPLPVVVAAGLSNEEIVAAAVPAFAAELKVLPPAQVAVEAGSGPVRVLDLHAAALVTVLRSVPPGGTVTVRAADVLDDLLGHEARFWQGSAARVGLTQGAAGLMVRDLRRIVAAGALLGAATRDEAGALLGRVPGITGSAKGAEWLRALYPPTAGDGGWLGSLAPDRLAERLVVAELGSDPELAASCLTGLDERQALRAITVLGRAAADQEKVAGPLLKRLLPLLEQVVGRLPDDLGVLTALSDAIPYPSAVLAEADLAVTRRILRILPPADPGMRARWLSWLGVTLSQTGRPTEALPAEQEATAIRRELAAADPNRYRPDLATSLSNMGVRFSALDRQEEALSVTQEAVEIRRELAAADPDQYRLGLARALDHLGVRFSALNRPDRALPPSQEAVEAYRDLAATYPARYRPDLVRALSNLGVRFSALDRPEEALSVTQEAVEIRRELAAADPARYRPGLARVLSKLGVRFSAVNRPDYALPFNREAVEVYRELTSADADRYRPDLAQSLHVLAGTLDALGQRAEAETVRCEADRIMTSRP